MTGLWASHVRAVTGRWASVRPSHLSARRCDALLAVGLCGAALWELSLGGALSLAYGVTVAGATLPLAWRRRYPVAAAGSVFTALLLEFLITDDVPPGLGDGPRSLAVVGAWLLALYSGAAYSRGRRHLVVLGVASGVVIVGLVDSGQPGTVSDLLANVLLSVVVPWLAGVLRRRVLRQRDMQDRLVELEAQRDAATRDERERIARELHDVVAHNVSMIVVQAEAGDALLDSAPARTRESLRAIQQSGRQALGEMRRLLGLLHAGSIGQSLHPPSTLSDLNDLVSRVRAAGLPVDLAVEGLPPDLPPGVQICAYRIVQEALTNALRHSGRTGARVGVRYAGTVVQLEITDDGPSEERANSGGLGLAGLGERAAACGGILGHGPAGDGGYTVWASLPAGPQR